MADKRIQSRQQYKEVQRKQSQPKIRFVESYQSEKFQGPGGMVDRKRLEYEQYMNYKANQLKKLSRHQEQIEKRKRRI